MKTIDKHIILMGFKNVGKSVLGKAIAKKINRQFIDLDEQLEFMYQQKTKKKFSCDQIIKKEGDAFFRNLETQALSSVIHLPPAVIALGGGTPIKLENQKIIKPHMLIHIKVKPELLFNRIMSQGVPAIFDVNEAPHDSFQRLWREREGIYQQLANITVNNESEIFYAVDEIMRQLQEFKI